MTTEEEILGLIGSEPVTAEELIERHRMRLDAETVGRHLSALRARGALVMEVRHLTGHHVEFAYHRPEHPPLVLHLETRDELSETNGIVTFHRIVPGGPEV
jgi:hypothetical protein